MRNMSLGITAFAVSIGMISVGAQGRNFSGTWVIDSEKTMAAAEATGGGTETRVARGVGGGGGGAAAGGRVISGGSGVAVGSTSVARGGDRVAAGGSTTAAGGGGRGVMISSDTVIAIDANTFSTDIGGVHTSYPLNGSEVTVQTRGTQTAKARASWKGDTLIIEQTIESPNGPVSSTTSWYLEGDSLVRLTTRRTYFKRK